MNKFYYFILILILLVFSHTSYAAGWLEQPRPQAVREASQMMQAPTLHQGPQAQSLNGGAFQQTMTCDRNIREVWGRVNVINQTVVVIRDISPENNEIAPNNSVIVYADENTKSLLKQKMEKTEGRPAPVAVEGYACYAETPGGDRHHIFIVTRDIIG